MDEAQTNETAKAVLVALLTGTGGIEVEQIMPDVEHPGLRWRIRLLTPPPPPT